MKERPILFSGPMVRTILDGSKTQTRRVIKTPDNCVLWVGDKGTVKVDVMQDGHLKAVTVHCPYGQPGYRLWVRETWQSNLMKKGCVFYRADQADIGLKWRPSIFMPRWASRITLEVTGVRVERVQDISEENSMAEGTGRWAAETVGHGEKYICHRHAFHTLWDSINAERGFGWDLNPWVWVVEFKRLA
ncbi:MAG: hypothetical protein V4568_14530 [Pseudomonadota bacterium]